jgi:hypothetical protein
VKDVPAALDMALEGQGLVLVEQGDPAQTGIEGVREAEIDDPVGAEERDGRLGPVLGQRIEPFPFSAAEDHDQRPFK